MRARTLTLILFVSLLSSSGLGGQPPTVDPEERARSGTLVKVGPISSVPMEVTPFDDTSAAVVRLSGAVGSPAANSSNETLIAGSATDESRPSMLMDRSGRLHVAYDYVNGSTDHDIGYAISDDGGRTWKNSRFPSADDVRDPDLATAENGTLWLVYETPTRDNVTHIFRSGDGGTTWYQHSIQFSSPRIRNVRDLEISVATNRSSSDALFMTGLAEFDGKTSLVTYYNDDHGDFAAWSVGLFPSLQTHTGPWIAASPGLAISSGSARAYIGWELQNNTDTDLGILYAEPWALNWYVSYFPSTTTASGNPSLMTDSVGTMFLVGDVVDGATTDLLLLWTDSNAKDVQPATLNTTTPGRNSYPRVFVDSTTAVVSYLVDGTRIEIVDTKSGTTVTAAASPAKPSAERRGHDVWSNSGTGPMAAWTDGRGGSADLYFWIETGTPGAPLLTHTPVATSLENVEVVIEATVTDDLGVAEVLLFYREDAQPTHTESKMTEVTTSRYRASIPAASVKRPALHYHIVATDTSNLSARSPGSGDHRVSVGGATPLKIDHIPVTAAEHGADVRIEANVTAGVSVKWVRVNYRIGAGGNYSSLDLGSLAGSRYSGSIPGRDVRSPDGVDYYLTALESGAAQPVLWKSPTLPQHVDVRQVGRAGSPTGGLVPWGVLLSVVILSVIVGLIIYVRERKRRKETPPLPPPPAMLMVPTPVVGMPLPPMPGYAPAPGPPPPGFPPQGFTPPGYPYPQGQPPAGYPTPIPYGAPPPMAPYPVAPPPSGPPVQVPGNKGDQQP